MEPDHTQLMWFLILCMKPLLPEWFLFSFLDAMIVDRDDHPTAWTFIRSLQVNSRWFFKVHLWVYTFLLWLWCNVTNPPQLQTCLLITTIHWRVRFWFRMSHVALTWCCSQDWILLMYAVITKWLYQTRQTVYIQYRLIQKNHNILSIL